MNTREDTSLPENLGHEKGWLNLSLGQQHLGDNSQSRPMKVYTCNFCKKKLYSSQALGGHQNAHKKERDAIRRHHQSPKLMVNRSLGIRAHSLVYTPTRGWEARYGVALLKPYDEEAAESKWPGGFYFGAQLPAPQYSQSSDDQHMLDLNLKL